MAESEQRDRMMKICPNSIDKEINVFTESTVSYLARNR